MNYQKVFDGVPNCWHNKKSVNTHPQTLKNNSLKEKLNVIGNNKKRKGNP